MAIFAAREPARSLGTMLGDGGGARTRPKPGRAIGSHDAAGQEQMIARLNLACAAAEAIAEQTAHPLAAGQRDIWHYNRKAMRGIVAYLAALESRGADRLRDGEAAIAQIAEAIATLGEIQAELRGTWGTYHIEWIRPIGIEAMQRRLAEART